MEGNVGFRSLAKEVSHTHWCGTLKLRQGSDVFVAWLPATKYNREEEWPRADPPGCSSEHTCLLQGRATSAFRS